ncbi:MAG: DNA repair protein RecN, partial [Pseudomonadota bacterium]
EAELAEDRATMLAGQKIAEDLATIDAELSGSKGALAALRGTARRIERIANVHDGLMQALAAIDRALIETDEVEAQLAHVAEAMSYDETRLDETEGRLFDLRALARKHNVAPEMLNDLLQQLKDRRAAIDAGDADLKAKTAALAAAHKDYDRAAARLTGARTEAAARLDEAMAAELPPLKLDAARFRTVIDALPEQGWGPEGRDGVGFEISTNPGAPFGPLVKIASGGELSRFILALKVALLATGDAGTMVFDEIDRGVGGATASAIGDRLARLAGGAQVLTVTHSPQVAARGRTHFRISKRAADGTTRTDVAPLPGPARREEIARMLSAADVTDEARAQADRLLAA